MPRRPVVVLVAAAAGLLAAVAIPAIPASAGPKTTGVQRHLLLTPAAGHRAEVAQEAEARGFTVRTGPGGALDLSGAPSLAAPTAGVAASYDLDSTAPVQKPRGYSGATISQAYGSVANPTSAVPTPTLTSSTPIVATIQLATWDSASLTRFAQVNGIYSSSSYDPVASGQWTNVPVSQQTSTTTNCQSSLTTNGAVEVALDQEAILGVAPALKERTYTARNTGSCVISAYQSVLNDVTAGLPIVALSTSWGACEYDAGASFMQTLSSIFAQLVAKGVTVTAATGDYGRADCNEGYEGADCPASDVSVLAMSATHHATGTSKPTAVSPDTAWNASDTSATGGGPSGFSYDLGGPSPVTFAGWPRPSWQTGSDLPSGSTRLLPDLSIDGDPSTGLALEGTTSVCDDAGYSSPCSFDVGGTSLSAPLMAGLLADLVAKHGVTRGLGLVQPTLYAHREAFTDVTGLSNGASSSSASNFTWPIGTGFDEATGLGTPDLSVLDGLFTYSNTGPASPAPASPTPSPSPTSAHPTTAAFSPAPSSAAPTTAAPTTAAPTTIPQLLATIVKLGKGIVRSGSGWTSTRKNAQASIAFTGTGIDLTFRETSGSGKVKVTVDGRSTTLDLWSKTSKDMTKKFHSLGSKRHSIVITVLGTHRKGSSGSTVKLKKYSVVGTGAARAL